MQIYRPLEVKWPPAHLMCCWTQEGEELTFFYGNIWFEDKAAQQRQEGKIDTMHEHMEDEHDFLAAVKL